MRQNHPAILNCSVPVSVSLTEKMRFHALARSVTCGAVFLVARELIECLRCTLLAFRDVSRQECCVCTARSDGTSVVATLRRMLLLAKHAVLRVPLE